MRQLFGLILALIVVGAHAQTPDTPVSFATSGEKLEQTIPQLEQSLGARITTVDLNRETVIKGSFSGNSRAKFLDDLTKKMRWEWAFGKNEVFLAQADSQQTISVEAPDYDVASRLQDLAIAQFRGTGSSITTKLVGKTVFVTGITPWTVRVAQPRMNALLIQAKNEARASSQGVSSQTRVIYAPKDPNQTGLMIFQLHNAWADDKHSTVNGAQQVVPGVATLFRQFTGMPALAPTQVYVNAPNGRMERQPNLTGAPQATRSAQAQAQNGPSLLSMFSKSAESEMAVAGNRGVYPDMRLNAILVRDKVSLFENYKELIQSLDRPTDMIQMDAFIVDINRSRINEFGLNLSWGNGNSVDVSGGAMGPANVVLGRAVAGNLLARLRALEGTGDSQFLTVPTVVSMSNMEAIFSARDNFYVSVSGFQDSSLNKVTAETILRVTPLIANDNSQVPHDERRVKLLVNIQDATVDSTSLVQAGSLPRILENQVTTQAVVRAGDTLVIGGQVVRKRVNSQNGLPFVSRVPVLNWFTSAQKEENIDYLRIYMVRPRILGEDSASANKVSKDGNVNLEFVAQALSQTKEQILKDKVPTVPIISSGQE